MSPKYFIPLKYFCKYFFFIRLRIVDTSSCLRETLCTEFDCDLKLDNKYFLSYAGNIIPRRIEGGADDLFAERHCPSEIYWKNSI